MKGFANRVTRGKSAGNQNASNKSKVNVPRLVGTLDFNDENAIMKALDECEREAANLPYERCRVITSDGKIWEVDGLSNFVDTSLIQSQKGSSLKGSYSYHNHPPKQTWFSFSSADVADFISNGEAFAKASDFKYSYIMRRTQDTVIADYDAVKREFYKVYCSDVYQMSIDEIIDIDEDGYHEAMKIMSKRYKFLYRRFDRYDK